MSDNKPDLLSLGEKIEAIVDGAAMNGANAESATAAAVEVCVVLVIDTQRKLFEEHAPKEKTTAGLIAAVSALASDYAQHAGMLQEPIKEASTDMAASMLNFALTLISGAVQIDADEHDSSKEELMAAIFKKIGPKALNKACAAAGHFMTYSAMNEYFSFAQFALLRKFDKTRQLISVVAAPDPRWEQMTTEAAWNAMESSTISEGGIRKFFAARVSNPNDLLGTVFKAAVKAAKENGK